MAQAESAAENNRSTSSKTQPTTTLKESKPWDFPLKLLISFVEALGRSSEDYYVYLPHAGEPRNLEDVESTS
jgi:hypothetical protein